MLVFMIPVDHLKDHPVFTLFMDAMMALLDHAFVSPQHIYGYFTATKSSPPNNSIPLNILKENMLDLAATKILHVLELFQSSSMPGVKMYIKPMVMA